MLRSNRGCANLCVCVCMCVCVHVWQRYSPNRWMDFDEIFHKWSDRHFIGQFFSDFEMSKSMTSKRHFALFVGALSRSQFCSNFPQNLRGGRKMSSAVCFLKSARSVGNFRQYGGPRFRKKIKMAAKNEIFETRQVRCLIRLKLTCWSRIW